MEYKEGLNAKKEEIKRKEKKKRTMVGGAQCPSRYPTNIVRDGARPVIVDALIGNVIGRSYKYLEPKTKVIARKMSELR